MTYCRLKDKHIAIPPTIQLVVGTVQITVRKEKKIYFEANINRYL